MRKVDGDVAAKRAAQARRVAEAARRADRPVAKAKPTDELSTGRGSALRRAAALRLPTSQPGKSAAPTGFAPAAFKVNVFGGPQRIVAEKLPLTPQQTRARADSSQIDAAEAHGAFSSAKDALARLISTNADPAYRQALVEASAGTLSRAATADSTHAVANTHQLLATIPDDAGKTTIVNAVLQQSGDPAVKQQVAMGTAPIIAATVKAMSAKDPVRAAKLLEQSVDAAPDEASKRAIVAAAQPAITEITKAIDHRVNKQQDQGQSPADDAGATEVLSSFAHIAATAGADGPKLVADAMAPGISRDSAFAPSALSANLLVGAVVQLGDANPSEGFPLLAALRDSLDAAGKDQAAFDLDRLISGQAPAALSDARDAFDDAKEKADELDGDLNSELKRLGPSLTEAQKQQYIASFHDAHADDYEKVSTAEARLSDTLTGVGPALLNSTDPEATREALDAAKVLAKTAPGAQAAIDFIALVDSHPDSPLRQTLGQNVEHLDAQLAKVRDDAIPTLYARDLDEAGGEGGEAAEKLQKQLESLEQGKTLGADFNAIRQGVEALRKGDFEALTEIGSTGTLGRAFQGAGVVLGIIKAGEGNQSAVEFVGNLASTGAEGAELVGAAANALKGSISAETLAAGEFLENKVAPGLSVIAGVLSTTKEFTDFLDGGNAGDVVSAIGGLTSTIGAVLDFTGVGAIVGVPLQIVGSLVGLIGGAISEHIDESRQHDEEKKLLRTLGFTDAQAKSLGSASADSLDRMAKLGVTAEQFQSLAASHPEVFANDETLSGVAQMASVLHLQPGELEGFLDAASKQKNYASEIGVSFTQLREQSRQAFGTDDAPASAQTQAYRVLLDNMSPEAQQFVQAKSPEVFDARGKTRFQADVVFEQATGTINGPATIAAALKAHSDPVFRAEIVRQMLARNEPMADQVRRLFSEGGDDKAIRESLQAARNDGVLTDRQLNEALVGL